MLLVGHLSAFAADAVVKKSEAGPAVMLAVAGPISTPAAEQVGSPLSIDGDFPGGNILVDHVAGDDAFLRQDLRDTMGWWFYWQFRVRGAAGRTIRFHFTNKNVLGPQGPAYSLDGGSAWHWLGGKHRNTDQYVESNLSQFLLRHERSAALKSDVLCKTAKGRRVEVLYLGRLDGHADFHLALTCRHHACESVASYVLEGLMETILAENPTGRWFRQHMAVMAVPFVDKDGVEAGDQGKNRKPHDHNRDYGRQGIYPTVAAIKQILPQWSAGKLDMAIDLHCPYLNDNLIQFIGNADANIWRRTLMLSRILESCQVGPLQHDASRNVPFGSGWNQGNERKSLAFDSWASGLPNVQIVTTVEIPFAQVGPTPTSATAARALGRDLATAIRTYLEQASRR